MAAKNKAPWPCRDYNKNGCTRPNCTHTHICFKFVDPSSFCNAGKECKFSHNINDQQVKSCLFKYGFDINVRPAELRKVYSDALKRRKGLLPKPNQNPNPSAPLQGQQQGIVDEIHRLTALLSVSNAPLVCLNFNQSRCTNQKCNLIHLCHAHIQRRCQQSFKNCPLSHDIFQPRIKELLMLAGFNVNQTPKGLMEDYRNALQVPPIVVQGRQPGPFEQGGGHPYSGKLAKAGKNVAVTKSYVDLRGESVKNKTRRGSSCSRKTQSTPGSGLDSDSSTCNDSSDGESIEGPIANTEKKTKNRRGRKKKQKPKATSVPQSKTSEPAAKDRGAIPKLKGKGVGPSLVGKPGPLHVSLLDQATICVNFLKGLCKDESCSNHHQNMPYLWQYKILQDGWKWKTFSKDNVQLLEQSFCNVSTTSCPLMLEGQKFDVDFDNMAASTPEMNLPIRRLTSASSLDNSPSFLTEWRWFWESDEGWIECGSKVADDKCANNHIQIKLEKAYQGDSSSNITVKMNDFKYSIDFSKMLQKNRESGTERRLRRRPKYFSPDDKIRVLSAEAKLGVEESLPSPVPQQVALPMSWIPMPGDREAMLVDVPKDSMDFRDITLRFQLTLPNSSIILLKRIQNPTLWMAMNLKKSKMEREHGEGKVAEMNLFHGTKPDAVNPICEHNFDWRLYGSATGTRFGKGVYFALQSAKADQYASQDENGLCFMFSARVLLGRYTQGNKSMRRPPPIDPAQPNKLFDSCRDDPHHPSVFVLFDKDQFYPEFIICYKK